VALLARAQQARSLPATLHAEGGPERGYGGAVFAVALLLRVFDNATDLKSVMALKPKERFVSSMRWAEDYWYVLSLFGLLVLPLDENLGVGP
jgi:hypothetical protein